MEKPTLSSFFGDSCLFIANGMEMEWANKWRLSFLANDKYAIKNEWILHLFAVVYFVSALYFANEPAYSVYSLSIGNSSINHVSSNFVWITVNTVHSVSGHCGNFSEPKLGTQQMAIENKRKGKK